MDGESLPVEEQIQSDVWSDFDMVKIPDGEGHGTSHLCYYLDTSCNKCRRPKRQKTDARNQLLTVNEGTAAVNCFVFDQERSKKAFVKMVIAHGYPFDLANQHFLRVFLNNLQPKFRAIERDTIRSDCVKLYEEEKQNLYEVLGNLDCRVSLTTDMWTSANDEDFLLLTCHYIDDSWQMRKRILNFVRVPFPHTSAHLCDLIVQKLLDWNIDKKVFSIVLDSCTENDDLVRELLNKPIISGALIPASGELFHVCCGVHILDIIGEDALELVKDAIDNIRETVEYIHHSEERIERFESVAREVNAPQTELFYDDEPTRWDSTFLMLQNILKFREAFSRLAEIDSEYNHNPSNEDWDNVATLLNCLKILNTAYKRISSLKYPTLNLFFIEFCEVYLKIRRRLTSEKEFVVTMATRMFDKFQEYWLNNNSLLAIASVLDPRCKLKPAEFYYRKIYPNEANSYMDNLKNRLHALFNEYVMLYSKNRTNQSAESQAKPRQNGTSSSGESSQSEVSEIRLGLLKFLQEKRNSQVLKSELEAYLEDSLVRVAFDDANFDTLEWWKVNSPIYPVLSRLARDILGVPVSKVASESIFSTGGKILDEINSLNHETLDEINSLNHETVQVLVCTQDWLRASVNESGEDFDGALSPSEDSIFDEDEN